MITIYFGRHGETDLNSEDRLRSWIDEPLNADGIKEAEAMAKKMEKFPLNRIYTSDLDRADKTARIVAKAHNLKPIPRQWFRPINYGEWNGKKVTDVKEEMQKLLDEWKTNPDKKAPGDGDSFTEFQDRFLGGLHAVINAASGNEQIMILGHLRNCLLLWAVAKNGEPLKGDTLDLIDDKHFHQESGSVAKYEWDGSLQFKGII
jgi:broad specificity phosphatase PhoE